MFELLQGGGYQNNETRLAFANKKPGQWPGHFGLPKDGARGRIRTTDTRIFSPLLYQLSYPGIL